MATELKARIEEHLGEEPEVEVGEGAEQPEVTFDDVLEAHKAGRIGDRDDLVMQYCDQLSMDSNLSGEELEARIDLAMKFITGDIPDEFMSE